MQNQLPLFLSYDEVRTLPIVQKYEKIFSKLDLSGISDFNRGIGANGNSQHALKGDIYAFLDLNSFMFPSFHNFLIE